MVAAVAVAVVVLDVLPLAEVEADFLVVPRVAASLAAIGVDFQAEWVLADLVEDLSYLCPVVDLGTVAQVDRFRYFMYL